MKKINYTNIGAVLVASIPEFTRQYDEYVTSQYGENLPHVLFSDFTIFVNEQFTEIENDVNKRNTFLKCMDFIERVLETDSADLVNLIAVSFLENLHQPDDYQGTLIRMKPYFRKRTLSLLEKMMGNNM